MKNSIGLWAALAGIALGGCALYELSEKPRATSAGEKPCLVDKVTDAEHAKNMASPVYRAAYAKYSSLLGDRPSRLEVPIDPARPDGPKKRVSNPPPVGCFAPGTSPEVVEAFMRAMQSAEDGAWPIEGEAEYKINTRWSHSGSTGDPITIYWSLVPDGTSWDGAASNLFLQMDLKFLFFGGRSSWINQIQRSFDRWEQLSGVNFVRVRWNGNDYDDGAAFGNGYSANLRGHIRIGMNSIDGVNGVLAYNYYPQNGDMKLDSSENWADPTDSYVFMRNIVTHELGHALGFAHVCSITTNELMEPFINTSFDGPQHDDTRAVQRNYGDNYEPNSTTATAAMIGDLSPNTFGFNIGGFGSDSGGTNVTRTSIFGDGDVDYYRFTTTKSVLASWSLEPEGLFYDDSPQSGGNCTSGTFTNSLAQADLELQLRDSADQVIASSMGNPLGSTEQISSAVLVPGTYYLRVSEEGTPTQSQLYFLTWQHSLTNGPPQMPVLGDSSINEESSFTFDVNATDPEGDQITYSLVTAPTGMTINSSTGLISWTPTEAQGPNAYDVTVRATDDGSPVRSSTRSFTVTVQEVNRPPDLKAINDAAVDEEKQFSTFASASDPDVPKNTLTYSLVSPPAGCTINASTGEILWTPSEAQGSGAFTIQVRASDNQSPELLDTVSFRVTVREINKPPVLQTIGNRTVSEETPLAFTAKATDPDAPANTLTYSLVGAPAGATINPSSGAFNWTPTEAQGPNAYTFTVRATDNGSPGLSDQETITVTVAESTKRLSGNVALQDLAVSPAGRVVRFEILSPGSDTPLEVYFPTLNSAGNYAFTMAGVLPAGTYDLRAKGSHWLAKRKGVVVISPTGALGVNFSLINGDVDGDNAVTVFDYAALSDAFDTVLGDPNWNEEADLDGDGAVTVFDYAILSSNFDLSGD